ncbi:MAG: alcohol dehydrogenase catalytic domain-containing protein [Ktedonobacteraceae bacterium]
MSRIPDRSREWFEVQRHHGQIHVARQSGNWPRLQAGQVLLKMVACGICGADIRVVTGNKLSTGDPDRFITLGHEGVGLVIAVDNSVTGLKPGDYAVVLPHIPLGAAHKNDMLCCALQVDPLGIGSGRTLHMGWDINGCFTDVMVVSATNLARVAPKYLRLATKVAPGLKGAIFALVEPMLCTLSAYAIVEVEVRKLYQSDLRPGRALVVGSGPVGILHGLILLKRGFEVWFTDSLLKRAALAQWCVGNRGHVLDVKQSHVGFDLVMVTASSAQAIRTGEALVRDQGIVYVFSGLNAAERTAMDREHLFFYERLHRTARSILTTTRLTGGEKLVLYLGHSGYFEQLASEAIAAVATNAGALDRAVTGIIPGWPSSRIISRLQGGVDWMTEDGSPAILSVLNGVDLRDRHSKLLVLANDQSCKFQGTLLPSKAKDM